jgi:IS1 family transposase
MTVPLMAAPCTAHWKLYVPGLDGNLTVWVPEVKIGVETMAVERNEALCRRLSRFVKETVPPGATVI